MENSNANHRFADTMRLNRLTPMLTAVDLKRTMAFYCDELGFRCRGTVGDPDRVWCHLERDGVRLMFNQPPEMADLPRPIRDFKIFHVYTDDVVGPHAAWQAKGLTVTELRVTDCQMKEFERRDPDGYWLWFGESTTEPPTASD